MWSLQEISAAFLLAFFLLPAAADKNKAEIDVHLQRARAAISRHDLKTATDEYNEVLRFDPGNVEIMAARGIALYALGQPSDAAKSLRAAVSADPKRGEAEAFLGLSLADLGDCRQALPLLKKQFELQLDIKVHRLLGLSLLGCSAAYETSDGAIEIARRLKRDYPDDPDVLYNVAELYSALSKQSVNELLNKHPDSFRIHQLAGEALEAQNNDAQALVEYRKALELNGRAPHLHYRIGTILLRRKEEGSEAQARQEFMQELAENPGDAASEYQIGEILRRQNLLDPALEHFTKAIELDPLFVEAHVGLAQIEIAKRQFEQATAHLETATRLAPENPSTHYSLMLAYRESGRIEEAKREMATVEDLNAKKQNDFNRSLHTLLTGHRDQP
jgi:tetratricopeptide (TPR) repeat protein